MAIKKQQIDFSQGNMLKALIAFSVPVVFGELIQNLYNTVDAFIVGNYVNKEALAAVTVCSFITNLIVSFFNGMSVGTGIVVSRAYGKGDKKEVTDKIRILFVFSLIFGVFLSAVFFFLASSLLKLAGANPDYFDQALIYLRIYIVGVLFTVVYNQGAGILRAIGDSQTPLYILISACVINIGLDLLFVAVLDWGITGAAWATVIAQAYSVVLIFVSLTKRVGDRCIGLPGTGNEIKTVILTAFGIGMTAGLQNALISFSNIFVVRYMNMFDTASVAGIGVAQKLDRFIILPAKALGITTTTVISQNYGAGLIERIRKGKDLCLKAALTVTIALSVLISLFNREIVALFNDDMVVVDVGAAMMRILLPTFWVMAIREVYLGVLRGYGYSQTPMVLSLCGMVGVRQLYLAIAMRCDPQIAHIYYCYPIAWFATTGLLLGYYYILKKKGKLRIR